MDRLKTDADVDSNTIGSHRRAKEDIEILIKAHSETGMDTYKRNDIALLLVYPVALTFGEPFIDLIYPTSTGIEINIECTGPSLAQMEIPAIIKRCSY